MNPKIHSNGGHFEFEFEFECKAICSHIDYTPNQQIDAVK